MECEDEFLQKHGKYIERCIYENVLGMRRVDSPQHPHGDTPLKRFCAMLTRRGFTGVKAVVICTSDMQKSTRGRIIVAAYKEHVGGMAAVNEWHIRVKACLEQYKLAGQRYIIGDIVPAADILAGREQILSMVVNPAMDVARSNQLASQLGGRG